MNMLAILCKNLSEETPLVVLGWVLIAITTTSDFWLSLSPEQMHRLWTQLLCWFPQALLFIA